jgi:phosphocarrier protein
MLSVLGASVQAGQEIEIVCDGPQEEEALISLVELVESNFGEL